MIFPIIEVCVLGSDSRRSAVLQNYPLGYGEHSCGNCSNAAIPLLFPTVSKYHACIEVGTEGSVFVSDRNSKNGTLLNGVPLPSLEKAPWLEGVLLDIGPFPLIWRAAPKQATPSNEVVPPMKADALGPLLNATDLYQHYLKSNSNLPGDGAKKNPWPARISIERCLQELDPLRSIPQPLRIQLCKRVDQEIYGDGPLTGLLSRNDCREIIANRYDKIFFDVGEGLQPLNEQFLSEESYYSWIIKTASRRGRRIDLQSPICDATLENGARFHAVLPPIAHLHPAVSIRRFGCAPLSEEDALVSGWLESPALKLLKAGIREKKNIVISGGTSTGKTSLLNFLCQWIDPNERVITIEDTVELSLPSNDKVQLQSRRENAEGIGQVTMRDLLQCALRMRPDRIIVGECRGAEVLEMLQALNTGHPGSLSTIHANSPAEAIHRMELLALLGAPNLPLQTLSLWIRHSVHWVVQVERISNKEQQLRIVKSISQFEEGDLKRIYERNPN